MGLFRDSRPHFEIKVAATEDQESLEATDLRIYHPACGNGVMKSRWGVYDDIWIKCERCRAEIVAESGERGLGSLFNTARDGVARWVNGSIHGERRDEYRGILVRRE